MEIIKIIVVSLFLILCTYRDLKSKEISILTCGFGALLGLFINTCIYNTNFFTIILGMLPALIILIFSLLTKGDIGMGDVLVIGVIGLNIGFLGSMLVLIIALIICGLCGLIFIMFKIKKYKDKIAFTPFILIGYFLLVFMEV